MTELKIGCRVRVRCICGRQDCLAPAKTGGAGGELVDLSTFMATVVLDGQERIGALDFDPRLVRREDA